MAHAGRTRAVLAAFGTTLSLVSHAAAEELPSSPTVVLHLDDYVRVPAQELLFAQQEVARVFRAAGVSTVWVDRNAPRNDGRTHLTVVILTRRQENFAELQSTDVLGSAAYGSDRAYVMYQRVRQTAALHSRYVGTLLGTVIAHEIGHLLLPERGHSMVGLMRADVELRSLVPPEFTATQSAAIRTALAARAKP